MITIISGTNRPGSNSLKIAKRYQKVFGENGVNSQVLSLEELPRNFVFTEMFGERTEGYKVFINKYIGSVSKFVFVVPEYNGSFPGILKAFVDSVHPQFFRGKKAALLGVSSGRSGNLKGLADFTGILHYLQVEVMAKKPKLSGIENLIDENGTLSDEPSVLLLQEQAEKFFEF